MGLIVVANTLINHMVSCTLALSVMVSSHTPMRKQTELWFSRKDDMTTGQLGYGACVENASAAAELVIICKKIIYRTILSMANMSPTNVIKNTSISYNTWLL